MVTIKPEAFRIALIDNHPAEGEGFKQMVGKEPDMDVTLFHSEIEALTVLKMIHFDVILFDLNMPKIGGLEFARRILSIDSDAIILLFTDCDIDSHFNQLIEAGVSGFIKKTSSKDQLLRTIRCAIHGEAVIPITLLKQLRKTNQRIINGSNKGLVNEVTLNETELAILVEVSKGKHNHEIAETLIMSQRSVEYHLTKIFKKLNVKSRIAAVSESRRLNLIPDINGKNEM
jgi:two-component system competent response regulator ComA